LTTPQSSHVREFPWLSGLTAHNQGHVTPAVIENLALNLSPWKQISEVDGLLENALLISRAS